MKIFIPTPLRPYADGKDAADVNATTISEALDLLIQTHPGLKKHLFTEEGKLRAFVNLYFNEDDVRYLPEKESTAVSASDTLSIIPSIAGGVPHSGCWLDGGQFDEGCCRGFAFGFLPTGGCGWPGRYCARGRHGGARSCSGGGAPV